MRGQRGVAMVLVLAVTGVLALLMLQIGLTSRQQVAQAQRLVDRVEAELRLHSRESALLYSMLTRERNADPRQAANGNPYAAVWNFRGEPFQVDGATIRVQDMSGLLPIPLPGSPTAEFAALLVTIGVDRLRADQAARSLQQALVTPRRMPLQSLEELAPIVGLSAAEIDRIQGLATPYPTSAVNPGTAPQEVLAVKYAGSALEGATALRRKGMLDERSLERLTGEPLDDMKATFLVGPGFRLDITVDFRGVRLRRQSIWTIRPASETNPLELWSYRAVDPVGEASPEIPR
jgi:hypothetical protein